ncbi:uncharacterized protein LOC134280937 [Saccostrea cucullata]|uniref:uncharacterized protein LOC134256752 n=1 Tax=Saccostrea cuccullata TaxID=36930 RepID=UPI002ED53B2F
MWHYWWAHFTYHLMRWFPRDNRRKIFVLLGLISLGLLGPQFYVLYHKHSTRWCPAHLFELLIVSIIFTFICQGFCLLFMIMNPVPRAVKVSFHVFGIICFVETLVHIAYTTSRAATEDCKSSAAPLYYISYAFAWVGAASLIFFCLMLPFWVINAVKPTCVLDMRTREGVCYEPVKCCSCMWHV